MHYTAQLKLIETESSIITAQIVITNHYGEKIAQTTISDEYEENQTKLTRSTLQKLGYEKPRDITWEDTTYGDPTVQYAPVYQTKDANHDICTCNTNTTHDTNCPAIADLTPPKGTCGHAVPKLEWKIGYRTCKRCRTWNQDPAITTLTDIREKIKENLSELKPNTTKVSSGYHIALEEIWGYVEDKLIERKLQLEKGEKTK